MILGKSEYLTVGYTEPSTGGVGPQIMRHYGPGGPSRNSVDSKDTDSDGLERKLGLFSVIIISLSAMIGSGLFVLPALAMLELGGGRIHSEESGWRT